MEEIIQVVLKGFGLEISTWTDLLMVCQADPFRDNPYAQNLGSVSAGGCQTYRAACWVAAGASGTWPAVVAAPHQGAFPAGRPVAWPTAAGSGLGSHLVGPAGTAGPDLAYKVGAGNHGDPAVVACWAWSQWWRPHTEAGPAGVGRSDLGGVFVGEGPPFVAVPRHSGPGETSLGWEGERLAAAAAGWLGVARGSCPPVGAAAARTIEGPDQRSSLLKCRGICWIYKNMYKDIKINHKNRKHLGIVIYSLTLVDIFY